ncbi:MAG TPA: hypothetical protein VE988_21530 [Gemmataceae bacterium]|nr:hypothetical protein [Gemmataceae bacterium]
MSNDEPTLYAYTIEPVFRRDASQVFFIMLEAKPGPECKDHGLVGGAFVNCWVNADDLRSAELRAMKLIEEYGWRPHRFDSWELVSRETYANRELPESEIPALQEIMEQAFVDGEVATFYQWPIDAPDA